MSNICGDANPVTDNQSFARKLLKTDTKADLHKNFTKGKGGRSYPIFVTKMIILVLIVD